MKTINTRRLLAGSFKLVLSFCFIVIARAAAGAQALPDGFTSCAGENEQCQFTGTKEVRYGADTRWKIMTATDGLKCDYTTFGGDPAYGTVKQCYIQNTPAKAELLEAWVKTLGALCLCGGFVG